MSYVLRQLQKDEFLRTSLTEEQKALYVSDSHFHYYVNELMTQYLDIRDNLPEIIKNYEEQTKAKRQLYFGKLNQPRSTVENF